MNRPICPACNRNPVAINYRKGNRIHYRSRCQSCINKNRKIRPPVPRWHIAGYVKKLVCDICKFRAKYPAQMQVYHRDGNLNNCELSYGGSNFEQGGIIVATSNKVSHESICSELKRTIRKFDLYPSDF